MYIQTHIDIQTYIHTYIHTYRLEEKDLQIQQLEMRISASGLDKLDEITANFQSRIHARYVHLCVCVYIYIYIYILVSGLDKLDEITANFQSRIHARYVHVCVCLCATCHVCAWAYASVRVYQ